MPTGDPRDFARGGDRYVTYLPMPEQLPGIAFNFPEGSVVRMHATFPILDKDGKKVGVRHEICIESPENGVTTFAERDSMEREVGLKSALDYLNAGGAKISASWEGTPQDIAVDLKEIQKKAMEITGEPITGFVAGDNVPDEIKRRWAKDLKETAREAAGEPAEELNRKVQSGEKLSQEEVDEWHRLKATPQAMEATGEPISSGYRFPAVVKCGSCHGDFPEDQVKIVATRYRMMLMCPACLANKKMDEGLK